MVKFLIDDDMASFQQGRDTMFRKVENIELTSSADVATTYESSQVAGDHKFFNKKLQVNAVVTGINSGIGNTPYLTLNGSNQFLMPQAHFQKPNMDRIINLKKGG